MAKEKKLRIACKDCRRALGGGHKMDCSMRYKSPKDRKWVDLSTNKAYTVSLSLFPTEDW